MNVIEPFVRQARAEPSRPAIRYGAHALSYGELLSAVMLCAARLAERGVQPGHRIACAGNPLVHVVSSLAAAQLGAVSCGISFGAAAPQLAEVLERFGVDHVLYAGAQPMDLGGARVRSQLSLAELLAPGRAGLSAAAAVDPEATWRISESSGTTGTPKGIAISHRAAALVATVQHVLFPMGPGEAILVGMTQTMSYAIHAVLRGLYGGATIVFARGTSPREILGLIREGQVTQLITVPGVAKRMVELLQQDPAGAVPHPIASLTVGGGRVSPQLFEQLRLRLAKRVTVNYGATETSLIAVREEPGAEGKLGTAGRLVPWMEAQALDDDGRVLAPGEMGRLRFRSPVLASGYVQRGEIVGLDAFVDGWFVSQDRGAVKLDGTVILAGRANEVIDLNGVKLDPSVIERRICEDASISDCVVVDVKGPLGQPKLVALVAAAEPPDAGQVRDRCKDLGPFHAPDLVLHARSLPHNRAGKPDRLRIRAIAQRALDSLSAGHDRARPH